jgi:hypothetical protein
MRTRRIGQLNPWPLKGQRWRAGLARAGGGGGAHGRYGAHPAAARKQGPEKQGLGVVLRCHIVAVSRAMSSYPKPAAPVPSPPAAPAAGVAPQPETGPAERAPPREVGGRGGPEPTRFGDWEKSGRCIDF